MTKPQDVTNLVSASNGKETLDVIIVIRSAMIYVFNNHTVHITFRRNVEVKSPMIDVEVLELIKLKIATDIKLGIEVNNIKYKDQLQILFSDHMDSHAA